MKTLKEVPTIKPSIEEFEKTIAGAPKESRVFYQ